MSDPEIAWLAGIIEGEGSIMVGGDGRCKISVQMTDLDIIERLQMTTGLGQVYVNQGTARSHYKPTHRWTVGHRSSVRHIVTAIRPWLGYRRRTAADAVMQRLDLVGSTGLEPAQSALKGQPLCPFVYDPPSVQ